MSRPRENTWCAALRMDCIEEEEGVGVAVAAGYMREGDACWG